MVGFWQGQDCLIGNKEGDLIELFGGWVTGTILKIKPKELFSYTWLVNEWDPNTDPSIVTYSLTQKNAETVEVSVYHTNLPSKKERASHESGWDDQFFDPMIEFLKQSADG